LPHRENSRSFLGIYEFIWMACDADLAPVVAVKTAQKRVA